MKRHVAILLSAAVVLSLAASATGGLAVDQEQPVGSANIASFGQVGLAQSFQQAHNNVAGAGILLLPNTTNPGESGSVTIALWDNLPNAGGEQLRLGGETGTAGNWVNVYWEPLLVVGNPTLYLVFTSTNSNLTISGSTTSLYPDGNAYAAGYESFPNYDYAFRTWYNAPDPVPVPGAVLLGTIGLGTAGYLTRRRTA